MRRRGSQKASRGQALPTSVPVRICEAISGGGKSQRLNEEKSSERSLTNPELLLIRVQRNHEQQDQSCAPYAVRVSPTVSFRDLFRLETSLHDEKPVDGEEHAQGRLQEGPDTAHDLTNRLLALLLLE